MLQKLRSQKGFTLIEVVAAAALIGVLATMLMPSLSGANDRVKNAKLSNDLAAIDQAIQVYRMDNGKLPASLTALDSSYLGGKLEFKDAVGDGLDYTAANRCIDAVAAIDVVIAQGSFGIGQGNRSIDSHLDGLVVEGRSTLWLTSKMIDFIDFRR